MCDYNEQLSGFSFEFNRDITEEYLKKYWLDKAEYFLCWKPIEKEIFPNYEKTNSKIAFDENFRAVITNGGVLQSTLDLAKLKKIISVTKDDAFVVVQDFDIMNPHERLVNSRVINIPPIRLKYNPSILYEELVIEDEGIGIEVFRSLNAEFFIYGSSGLWGYYVNNEYFPSFSAIGVSNSVDIDLKQLFTIDEEDFELFHDSLPDAYKVLV